MYDGPPEGAVPGPWPARFLRGRGDRVWQPNANWMGVAFQVCKQLLQTLTMMQGLSIL